MKHCSRLLPAIAAALLAACTVAPQQPPAPVEKEPEQQPLSTIPVLSVTGFQASNVAEAYAAQRDRVTEHLRGRTPAGFKAGLTAKAGQREFGVDEPVAGVLWPGGGMDAAAAPATVSLAGFRQPMLEQELAFRISARIDRPLSDIRELRRHVDRVYPALELPDLGFGQGGGLTGTGIIAANVGASRFVLGQGFNAADVDINAVFAELERDGELLQKADATAVMKNQWRALLWLVNRTVNNGWTIEPGQILLTGAMGAMLPLQAGRYVANYGELGRIELVVEP